VEASLSQAEAEMAGLEVRLAEAVARTEGSRVELAQRLALLRERARRSRQEHEGHEDVTAVAEQLEAVALPSLEGAEAREEALRAREHALELRRAALRAGEDGLRRYQERARQAAQTLEVAEDRLATAVRAAKARARAGRLTPPPTPREGRPPLPRKARVAMQAAIDLRSDSNFFTGFSTNLSAGGVFVATVQQVPRGTPVDLTFTLPGGGPPVRVPGVVRWSREVNDRSPGLVPGLGVQFTELPAEVAQAITGFIETREPLLVPD
jgi:uncharacterized protein (TIGR02266 family)